MSCGKSPRDQPGRDRSDAGPVSGTADVSISNNCLLIDLAVGRHLPMLGTIRTCFRIFPLKGRFLSRIVDARAKRLRSFRSNATGSTLPDVVGDVEVIVIYWALGGERSSIDLAKSVLLQICFAFGPSGTREQVNEYGN